MADIFPDDSFNAFLANKMHFLGVKNCILVKMSLMCVDNRQTGSKSLLVQVMGWN